MVAPFEIEGGKRSVFTLPLRSSTAVALALAVVVVSLTHFYLKKERMTSKDSSPSKSSLWPETVIFVYPDDSKEEILEKIQKIQDPSISTEINGVNQTVYTSDAHFSSRRYVLAVHPGIYKDAPPIQVGYYSQVVGLGRSPSDTHFVQGGPCCPALNKHVHPPWGTSLDTFWRSVENVRLSRMQWAVSQAAPLRNVHVDEDLVLFDGAAYASGGHLANATVGGTVQLGGQQQYLLRKVQASQVQGGAWSRVLVECEAPIDQPVPTTTQIKDLPQRSMEKPYVVFSGNKFQLLVPQPNGQMQERDFDNVFVATSTQGIQQALDQGKDVLLTPGIYAMESTLTMRHDNQVLLGWGLATLVSPTNGAPCLHVLGQGCRVAGIMLEASERDLNRAQVPVATLLEWGTEEQSFGSSTNPGGLWDIFCRVGGASLGDRTRIHLHSMVRIHMSYVLGDNLWLWRADHALLRPGETANYPEISTLYHQSEKDEYVVKHGLVVTGDHAQITGLAVEHTNEHQVIWKGEHGSVYFYQCEFPYGVGEEFVGNYGYLVHDSVQNHKVFAPGVYSNFRNTNVTIPTAMKVSNGTNVVNGFVVKLDNKGAIASVVNNLGPGTTEKGTPAVLGHFP